MSNNNNSKKNNNGKNGNGNNTTQRKGKRSAAAMARRAAKWASQKAEKKAESVAKHHAEKAVKEAEKERKVKTVLEMFPNVMGLVGAQGFMPNIRQVKQVSKTMKTKLNAAQLFQNADRATVYPGGRTVLGHYMEEGNWEKAIETLNLGVSKKVLESHTVHGGKPLVYAFYSRNFEIFKKLLEKRADPNQSEFYLGTDTPILNIILLTRDSELTLLPYVRELIKHKVNVNKLSPTGRYPLDDAIISNNNAIAKLLIDNGAKMEITNEAGFTPVLTAISKGNREILNYMREKGIHMDKQTGPKVLFPLKIAVTNGTQKILEDVLEDVKEINAKDANGNTALHYAVMIKSFPKISLLLTKGANPKIKNGKGQSALDIARGQEERGNARAYDLLKEV